MIQKVKNKYDISEKRKKELSELAEFIAEEYFPNTLVCPYRLSEIYGIS